MHLKKITCHLTKRSSVMSSLSLNKLGTERAGMVSSSYFYSQLHSTLNINNLNSLESTTYGVACTSAVQQQQQQQKQQILQQQQEEELTEEQREQRRRRMLEHEIYLQQIQSNFDEEEQKRKRNALMYLVPHLTFVCV